MAKKTQFEQSRFYFNEYRRFPLEKLFIPILIGAAIVGLYFGGQAFLRSRGPTAAAEQIMGHLQEGDPLALSRYINFTDDERRRLDFGGGPERFGDQIIRALQRSGYVIESFKVSEVPSKDGKAQVPVEILVRSTSDNSTAVTRITLPLEHTGGRWRFTSADMRNVLGIGY